MIQIKQKTFLFILSATLVSCSTSGDRRNLAFQGKVPLAVEQKPEIRAKYEDTGSRFMVATQGEGATQAAQKIYALGGNIIDAFAAASFAISVERPQSTGIAGGGFLVFRQAKTGKVFAVDFRERAPLKASERMFLDEKGEIIPKRSSEGIFAAGVPGLVKGILEIHEKFGSLTREQIMAPAIEMAEKGFVIYPHLGNAINEQKALLAKYPASKAIFLKANGEPYKAGETLVQKDLAETLRKISKDGARVFYEGSIATAIVNESKAQGGLISAQDLKEYAVKWREPVRGQYKGYEIYSMPPPSSGGTHVVEILNILESDSLDDYGHGSANAIHLEASAMQQAFADRAAFMGDPDFFKEIPLKGLLSKSYARNIRKGIALDRAKTADQVAAGKPADHESSETTNFSMMDSEGNVVVSTQTVNGWLGSGIVVRGTGMLLNNEMDDFSAKPGDSNIYGAIGGIPNSVAPRKTPLSSMAPTIVLKGKKPVLALGAPGGTRIITCVAQTMLNYLEFGMPLYESVAGIRVHHQWKPDQLDIETPGFGAEVTADLEHKGYKVKVGGVPCRVNAVALEGQTLHGVADPRDIGSAFGE
jgi:gamma-glutamyltranspeptidase / glutathione hydrolase